MRLLILLAVVTVSYPVLGQVKKDTLTNNAAKVLKSTDTSQHKQGHYKYYYSNGKLQEEGGYVDDKRQGLWILYWANGNMESETVYTDDQPDGYYRAYNRNGKLIGLGFKKFGVLNGSYFVVDSAGNNTCELIWELGILKSEKLLSPNVKIEGTEDTINGVRYIWYYGQPVNADSIPKSKMPYTGIILKKQE